VAAVVAADQTLKQILPVITEDPVEVVVIIKVMQELEIEETGPINQQELLFQHKDIMEEHHLDLEMVVEVVEAEQAALELLHHHQTLVLPVVMD